PGRAGRRTDPVVAAGSPAAAPSGRDGSGAGTRPSAHPRAPAEAPPSHTPPLPSHTLHRAAITPAPAPCARGKGWAAPRSVPEAACGVRLLRLPAAHVVDPRLDRPAEVEHLAVLEEQGQLTRGRLRAVGAVDEVEGVAHA